MLVYSSPKETGETNKKSQVGQQETHSILQRSIHVHYHRALPLSSPGPEYSCVVVSIFVSNYEDKVLHITVH
jgi:hypothetical protein